MSSTFSPLKIELITSGEQSGTWGDTTNTNLGTAIEEAIVGNALVTFASADVTLTLTNVNTTQTARNLRLELTGTSGGARNLYVPAIEKPYIVANGLADAVTVINATGTGVVVPAGKSMWVYNNGSDVVNVVSHLTALSLGTALPVSSGGTGSTSTTYCSLTTNVTGTLPVANGGTGATTFTSGALLKGAGAGALTVASAADIVSAIGATAVTNATNATTATTANALNTANNYTIQNLALSSVGSERTITWNLTGRNVYLFGRDSDDAFGLYDTVSGTRFTSDTSGNFTATGDVTAYSDERLKKDWSELSPAFLEDLAKVKFGTYTRIDSGERQLGASAQDIQKIAPEAVQEGEYLSLAYGNVALVAAIQLAKKVEELTARLALLEGGK